MTRRLFNLFIFALAGLLALGSQRALAADAAPDLIGTNALVAGATEPLVSQNVFEKNLAYLRINGVEAGLDEAITGAWAKIYSTNGLIGVVVDLRYADGGDFVTAQASANLLAAKKLPLTILVNGKTRGEAVALAAILRDTNGALVFGSTTEAVKFTGGPLQPDIAVKVGLDDERIWFADAFKTIQHTNQMTSISNALPSGIDPESLTGERSGRISEADLVRQRLKDTGAEFVESPVPARPSEPQIPLVKDPVLARALDLLKGLAIVREAKL